MKSESYFSQSETAIDTIEAYLDDDYDEELALTPKQIKTAIATARMGHLKAGEDLESQIEKCLAKLAGKRSLHVVAKAGAR